MNKFLTLITALCFAGSAFAADAPAPAPKVDKLKAEQKAPKADPKKAEKQAEKSKAGNDADNNKLFMGTST